MIENLPVKTLSFKGLTIEGYWRAAVQSYWRIQELKLGFELGAARGRLPARRRFSSPTRTSITWRRSRSLSPAGE